MRFKVLVCMPRLNAPICKWTVCTGNWFCTISGYDNQKSMFLLYCLVSLNCNHCINYSVSVIYIIRQINYIDVQLYIKVQLYTARLTHKLNQQPYRCDFPIKCTSLYWVYIFYHHTRHCDLFHMYFKCVIFDYMHFHLTHLVYHFIYISNIHKLSY